MWDGVIHQQAVLQMLTGVGEVQPQQLGVAAGLGERHRRGLPDQVAAQAHCGGAQYRVAAQPDVLRGDVHRVLAQSCTLTTVSRAPSARTTSTFSA